jgi:hypothetical protein
MSLALFGPNSNGDSDMYVKHGTRPRRDSYDGKDLSRNSNYNVTIDNPEGGAWYAGIYGFVSCQYTITLHAASTSM